MKNIYFFEIMFLVINYTVILQLFIT